MSTYTNSFHGDTSEIQADAFKAAQEAQSALQLQQGYFPTVQPPRCECHSCTQARVPSLRKMQSFVQHPPMLDPEAMNAEIAAKVQEAVLAERERCAKIAGRYGAEIVPTGAVVSSVADWTTGFRTAERLIAAKIRGGTA